MCLGAERQSSTLRIELTVPMLITATLVLCSPLFGPFTHQLLVKLFSVLLQFICFQFLVERTPDAGFGDQVPKICPFLSILLFFNYKFCPTPRNFNTVTVGNAIAMVSRIFRFNCLKKVFSSKNFRSTDRLMYTFRTNFDVQLFLN